MPLTFVGGLALGIGSSLLTKWFLSGALVGLAPSLPFIVLFVLLLVLPKRFLVERSAPLEVRARTTWTAPPLVQIAGGVIAITTLALVPTFAGYHLADWTLGLARSKVPKAGARGRCRHLRDRHVAGRERVAPSLDEQTLLRDYLGTATED